MSSKDNQRSLDIVAYHLNVVDFIHHLSKNKATGPEKLEEIKKIVDGEENLKESPFFTTDPMITLARIAANIISLEEYLPARMEVVEGNSARVDAVLEMDDVWNTEEYRAQKKILDAEKILLSTIAATLGMDIPNETV